jgi:Cysteine-rich CPCC
MFDEPPGSYEICAICGWEDDVSQLRFPRMSGGANKVSLIQGQRNFAGDGDSDPWHPPLGRPAAASDVRDRGWRPIDETRDDIEQPVPGVEYGPTYPADYTGLYYWRPSYWRAASRET